MIHLVT